MTCTRPARLACAAFALLVAGCQDATEDTVRVTQALVSAVPGSTALVEAKLPHNWKALPRDVGAEQRAVEVEIRFDYSPSTGDLGVLVEGTTIVFTALVNGSPVESTGDARSRAISLYSARAAPDFRIPASALRPGTNVLQLRGLIPPSTRWPFIGPFLLGAAPVIERIDFTNRLAQNVGPMIISAVLIAVGLVSVGLWRGRRDNELFLLLAGGTLIWGAQGLLQQWPAPLLPSPHNSVLFVSMYVWFPMLIAVFFLRFADERSRLFERIAALLAALAAPALYAGSAFDQTAAVSVALRGLVLVLISIALLGVLRFAWRTRNVTGALLFAISCVCIGFAFRDFIVTFGPSDWNVVILTPYSGVALVLFAGWMLLERYHRAYAGYEMLTVELEERVARANVELHRRLDQVEAAHRAAEQANVSKSRFFAAASHDLRQPLHSLGLFASALRDRVDEPGARDLVVRIGDSIEALDRLFDELLDLSRLDAGTVEVRRRAIALQDCFDRLDAQFGEEAERKGLRLRLVPTALVVETDPSLLERILVNLVANAIRYTPKGGVLVGARKKGRAVRLEVIDTGIGIAAHNQELVFDEFYQVHNPGRDRRKGLGLGLAIVRRLTTLLGHSLSLRSVEGRGTRFMLDLPPAEGPAMAAAASESVGSAPFAGRKVLVIDDQPDIVDATLRLLGQWGLDVRAASSPSTALDVIADGFVPEVILADLRLDAASDGIDVVNEIRRRLGPIPALLLSGDTGARELVRVKQSGFLLLTKPVAPAKLRSALHALLTAGDERAIAA